MNTNEKNKTILFGALDWGLGHATRSMPLIDALIGLGHQVVLTSSGDAAQLWRLHYPQLPFLSLADNAVVYGKNASWSALLQSPRFLKNIRLENLLVQKYVAGNKVDLIVSDNRYGLYHPKVPSILITHQLQLMPPQSWPPVQKLWENSWNLFRKPLFAPFREIWVPDFVSEQHSLAGELSKNAGGLPVKYIGPLSRLHPKTANQPKTGILLLLSGPEPQRSMLEALLLQQLVGNSDRITLVRGLITKNIPMPEMGGQLTNFRGFDYLNPEELSQEIANHALVISRSGYSTIMDLQQLGAKAVFVPTPGQAEQEYLASSLSERKIAAYQPQNALNLTTLIASNRQNIGFVSQPALHYDQLWLETLSSLEA